MKEFVVSARKYRPVSFDAVVGQPAVAHTLKSAIKNNQTAHAYLFCGPRGVGKTTCARIFAKTLNCFNLTANTEACDQCESCRSFNESRSFNIHELDAASNNSVEDIRSLIDKVRILPQVGKFSIYIIDEVHMLSQAAFNAFLKTLEEPPAHAVFVLATTEKHKIIPTILSRCQIFDFHRIRVEDIVGYLAQVAQLEGISYEEEALNVIALKADGAMRDALSIFDQVASFANRNITYQEVLENLNVLDYEYYFRITEAFLEGSAASVLVLFNEILQRGFDGQNFMGGLASHLRDLLVCHDPATLQLLEVSDSLKSSYKKQAERCSGDFLFTALEICNQCELSYKSNRNQRLHVELALIRLAGIAQEKKKPGSEPQALTLPDISQHTEWKKIPESVRVPDLQPVEKASVLKETGPVYRPLSGISIKDALQSAAEDPDHELKTGSSSEDPSAAVDHEEHQPLSGEFLEKYWNAYASQIREYKPRMAVTLKSVQPCLTDQNTIGITLNNRSQLDDFNNTVKSDLEGFLRREMKNPGILVTACLVESADSEQIRLYTNEEKFRYLSQKNPLLLSFRQKLNLELE